ncbi:hypothetical protein V8J36_16130 [Frigidibacter sp. MR17.14]|uniref:hypothetical protein n=1 Tax=Frigidibacter sp. MR17.14 TaxID=3126509 RepID=UPI003013050A
MIGASKILTVSYGTFSCTLEGFDEPFSTMKAIAEYFRDLAAEDRYFGAEPPTPDAEMLHKIAEREIQRRVEAKIQKNGVILRPEGHQEAAEATPQPPRPAAAPVAAPVAAAPAPLADIVAAPTEDAAEEGVWEIPAPQPRAATATESVAEKLARIRAAVADVKARQDSTDPYAAPVQGAVAGAMTFAATEDEDEIEGGDFFAEAVPPATLQIAPEAEIVAEAPIVEEAEAEAPVASVEAVADDIAADPAEPEVIEEIAAEPPMAETTVEDEDEEEAASAPMPAAARVEAAVIDMPGIAEADFGAVIAEDEPAAPAADWTVEDLSDEDWTVASEEVASPEAQPAEALTIETFGAEAFEEEAYEPQPVDVVAEDAGEVDAWTAPELVEEAFAAPEPEAAAEEDATPAVEAEAPVVADEPELGAVEDVADASADYADERDDLDEILARIAEDDAYEPAETEEPVAAEIEAEAEAEAEAEQEHGAEVEAAVEADSAAEPEAEPAVAEEDGFEAELAAIAEEIAQSRVPEIDADDSFIFSAPPAVEEAAQDAVAEDAPQPEAAPVDAELSEDEVAAVEPEMAPEAEPELEPAPETVAAEAPRAEPAPVDAAAALKPAREGTSLRSVIDRARARVIRIRRSELAPAAPVAAEPVVEPPMPDVLPAPAAARADEPAPVVTPEPVVQAEPEVAALPEPAPSIMPERPVARSLRRQAPAEEEDLLAKIAAAEHSVQPISPRRPGLRPDTRLETPAEPEPGEQLRRMPADDAAVARLIETANKELSGPEHRRRYSAIAHLKAAVVATAADRVFADRPARDNDATEAYRDDLTQIVRPRRPGAGGEARVATPRPAPARPAPLVLVSEQRVDAPRPDIAPAPAMPIRPRRVSADAVVAAPVEIDEDEDFTPPTAEEARSFAEFADRLGAQGLSELLEAAAVYTSTIEGRPHFSRPQIMKKISVEDGFTREAGLRSFGMLLRQGKIQKVRRGQFAITTNSRFMAEARRAH